jgi:MATE family multidrug resistance protein
VADVLAWSMFSSFVMARAGEDAMAANMFSFRFMSVSFMPALGIGTAITALVGRYIGMGRPDLAMHRAHLGFKVNVTYMLTCGLLFFVFRHELMRLFSDKPEVLRIGSTLLVFAAVFQLSDAMYCTYSGALRGAGDTFVPAMATGIMNWTMSVGLGYVIVRLHPEWGAAGPWTIATIYSITLSTYIYIRFKRGGWRSIRLERADNPDRVENKSPSPLPSPGVPGEGVRGLATES